MGKGVRSSRRIANDFEMALTSPRRGGGRPNKVRTGGGAFSTIILAVGCLVYASLMLWNFTPMGNDATSGPLRSLTTMATMPFPPRPLVR